MASRSSGLFQRKLTWTRIFAVIWLLGLAACQGIGRSTPEPSFVSLETEAASPVVVITTEAATAAPTRVLQPGAASGSTGSAQFEPANLTQVPSPVPDPLRFVYPTQGPEPVSAWRPPLYPVPWAPSVYDHFYFVRPIAADEVNSPVQDYRYGGEFFADVVHTGVDIPAPKGTPVLAAGAGKVVWAGYGVYRGGYDITDPYGLAVTIRHDFGYQNQALYTVYGHLDQIDVAEGQYVETGTQLGLVGETGNVTGPHLHFEIRLGENNFFTTRNPELWLVPPQGWGVLAGRVLDTNGNPVIRQEVIVTAVNTEQNWFARSYGPDSVNSDPYYQENLVVGDLPAGTYEIRLAYAGVSHRIEIEIKPGLVSYFTFRGRAGFNLEPPPTPGADFTPEPESTSVP